MSKNLSHPTEPEHWAEWFEKCALARCGDKTRHSLGIFAHLRYEKYLSKALKGGGELPVEARDLLKSSVPGACWHDLEASYWFRSKPTGQDGETDVPEGAKIYKKFHSEVASTIATPELARDYLEAKASENLIWTRCRSIITKAIPRAGGMPDESGKSPEDLALENNPDSASISPPLDVGLREDAERIFVELTTEERILFLAKANDIPLGNSSIENRLGHKKSILYTRQSAALRKVRTLIGIPGELRHYEGDLVDTGRVLDRLLNLLAEWARTPECGIGGCLMDNDAKK